jgi:hypothetical protein
VSARTRERPLDDIDDIDEVLPGGYPQAMSVVESLEKSLQNLPDEDRDQLGEAFVELVQLAQAETEPLSDTDRHAWFLHLSRALEGFGHAVVVGTFGSGKSAHLAHALAESVSVDAGRTSLAELEKLNAATRFEQWRQAIRESFSTAELEEKFGVSRQRLEQLRKQRKLFGVQPPFERSFSYPAWQFDDDGRPRDLVPTLLEAAEEARIDALSLHRLMVSETATPRGPLLLALKEGEDAYVLDVVRTSGAQGS